MKIYAFDFETANPDYSSICQFGLAKFTNGELTDTYETLIDPEEYFDDYNTNEVHG
jgi:DNA polymerase-3 subunit epsilon